ncbi:MAG: pantoate--beta-alanine ligase [Actinobacteria bacterium]|nr:pantoate--beta-alanine ligase [Actinomycetota bacterium]
MNLLKEKQEVRDIVTQARARGRSVGLVPTMGYLHEGHLSLVRQARAENDLVVVSIYVNPTQFGPTEDLGRYPRDLERDLSLCREVGVDIVWNPLEMYDSGHRTWVVVEELTERLCGISRPSHFRGVTTVVAKLFGVVRPDRAYFGQKDAQQAFVIRRMTQDLDMGVDIVVCPTIREADGLAMSSRNVYLTPEQRTQAPLLRRALMAAEEMVATGERRVATIRARVEEVLAAATLGRIDYVEIVNTQTLQGVEEIGSESLLALAVFFGKTRLIDNTILRIS